MLMIVYSCYESYELKTKPKITKKNYKEKFQVRLFIV